MSRKSRKRNRTIRAHQEGALFNPVENPEANRNEEEYPMNLMDYQVSDVGFLSSATLELDLSYQRPTDPIRVKKIAEMFDPALVNALKVSVRDGHNYVFDGGHTLAALKLVYKRNDFPVLCQIFHGLTYEQEATLFAKQRGNSKPVGIPYKLRALEAAGDDETVDFLERTRRSGFEIRPGERQVRNGNISAVKSAYDAFKRLGPVKYEEMMKLIKKTWDGESWTVHQNMLGGLSEFFRTYDGMFKEARFLKKLQGVSRSTMDREASKHYGISPSIAYAMAITTFYNKGGAVGTLDVLPLSMKA